MCNHYKPGDDPEDLQWALDEMLAKLFPAPPAPPEWLQGFEVYPKGKAPVVYQTAEGRFLGGMRWGVAVTIEQKTKYVTNARNDKLLSSFTWKFAVRERRCVLPARGYFEPGTGPDGARGELFFTVKERPRFFLAGLWNVDSGDSGARAFAMVTTTPNDYAGRFHDRMPVILTDADAKLWIGDRPLPEEQLLSLCRPAPDDVMHHVEIAAVPRAKKVKKSDLSRDGELLL